MFFLCIFLYFFTVTTVTTVTTVSTVTIITAVSSATKVVAVKCIFLTLKCLLLTTPLQQTEKVKNN